MESSQKKICIIKLDAKGDVIRTLPLLIGIKTKFVDSNITWITKKSSEEILKTSHYIDRVISLPLFEFEKFDVLYNFDIDNEATDLIKSIAANKKYGFYKEDNFVSSFNLAGEYYLNTVFDDETKINNKKTYQEMMFDIAELPYNKECYPIIIPEKYKKYAKDFVKENKINKEKLIGIHLGAADRWPSKKWHLQNLKEFITKAKKEGYEIILFGGPDEIQEHEKILNELKNNNISIHRNNPHNLDLEFAALVNQCKLMICSDSFALHISLALKKSTIGLFFCTPPDEIESYNLLKKIVAPKLYDFFPEKMDIYNEELTKSISADEVLKELEKLND